MVIRGDLESEIGKVNEGAGYRSRCFSHLKPTFSGCGFWWVDNHDNALFFNLFPFCFEI